MYSEEIAYKIESIDELGPAEKRDNWYISFGLQAVDGLKPSEYMRGLAGEFREYNISKEERVLSGISVLYSSADMIHDALAYDFEREKGFDYSSEGIAEQAHHVMKFISGIWQVHPFAEGNTRTCAVFAIQYLRALGFAVGNEPFREHSQYFRDALVMDNCGRDRKPEYLKMFTENLLLGGSHDLGTQIPAV